MKFKCNEGLYYYDTNSNNHSKSKVNNYGVNLLNTVANNKSFFTKRQIKNAETARQLQQCIGWPSSDAIKIYISKNMINNSKVGMDDIERGIKIYGPPEPLLSGKKTASSQTQFINCQVQLPIEILQHHKHLQLFMDIFYVNRISFLITKKQNKSHYR